MTWQLKGKVVDVEFLMYVSVEGQACKQYCDFLHDQLDISESVRVCVMQCSYDEQGSHEKGNLLSEITVRPLEPGTNSGTNGPNKGLELLSGSHLQWLDMPQLTAELVSAFVRKLEKHAKECGIDLTGVL